MVKSIGSPNAELRFASPNNPATSTDPTNGYLKNLSKTHRYHKRVPMFGLVAHLESLAKSKYDVYL